MQATSAITSALLALAATSSLAAAEDVRLTFTGTVSSLGVGGTAPTPFASAQIGEAVTIVADAEVTLQLPFGRYLYALNAPTTSVSVGGTTERLDDSPSAQVTFNDDTVQLGDYVAVYGQLATSPSTNLQVAVSDPSGATWSTDDIRTLIGTTIQLGGLDVIAQVYGSSGALNFDLQSVRFDPAPGGPLGTPYCTAEPNSTGAIGETTAYGLDTVGDNDLSLIATGLPTSVFGYFVASQTQGFTPAAGGGSGNLCLSGAIGRFIGPGQVKSADFGGEIAIAVDLNNVPTPTTAVAVQAGESWNIQLWHRDSSPAGTTSNFTRGLRLTFQ